MQNFVRQWTKKSTGQCVRWFEKSTGQFKKPPAFVRFPVLNSTPDRIPKTTGVCLINEYSPFILDSIYTFIRPMCNE